MTRKILLVFVHGTNLLCHFKDIPWPPTDSVLVPTIKEYFLTNKNIVIRNDSEFSWKGRNSDASRRQHSIKLARHVEQLITKNDGDIDEVYLISHSHGFILCDQSISHMNEKTAKLIKGLVGFNSPQINTLKRDFFRNFARNVDSIILKLLPFSISTFILNIFISYKFYLANNSTDASVFYNFIPFFLASFSLMILCICLLRKRFALRKLRILGRKIQRNTEYSDSEFVRKKKIPFLQINSSGDEAWNILSIIGSISQIPFYLTHKSVTTIATILLFLSYFHTAPSALIYHSAMVGAEVNSLSLCEYIVNFAVNTIQLADLSANFLNYLVPIESFISIFDNMEGILLELFTLFTYFFFAVISVSILAIAGFLSGYLLNLVYERGLLGFRIFERVPAFVMSRKIVEVLPHHYKNTTFFDSSIGSSGLNHSAGYEDKLTIFQVCKWIKNRGSL